MNDGAPASRKPESGGLGHKGLALAALVIVLDQITKWLILDAFLGDPAPVEVLPFFNLVLTWNPGVSFGMFGGLGDLGPWILTIFALVIAGVMGVWMFRTDGLWTALGLSLLVGGALGNVIDRVRFGAVVDFLDFHVSGYHWPAFNVADSAITVGAAVLIIEALFSKADTP